MDVLPAGRPAARWPPPSAAAWPSSTRRWPRAPASPPERVDLAPLAALSALRARPARGAGRVDVILGDAAYCLACLARRRAARPPQPPARRRPGEADRLRREVDRTAALAGNGAGRAVRVVGAGARGLIGELRGRAAPPPRVAMEGDGLPVEAAELAWLGAALDEPPAISRRAAQRPRLRTADLALLAVAALALAARGLAAAASLGRPCGAAARRAGARGARRGTRRTRRGPCRGARAPTRCCPRGPCSPPKPRRRAWSWRTWRPSCPATSACR